MEKLESNHEKEPAVAAIKLVMKGGPGQQIYEVKVRLDGRSVYESIGGSYTVSEIAKTLNDRGIKNYEIETECLIGPPWLKREMEARVKASFREVIEEELKR